MRSLQLTREVRLDERKIRCLDFESAYQPATRMEDALSRLRLVRKAGAAQCDIETGIRLGDAGCNESNRRNDP
jgi:hypothetical protein